MISTRRASPGCCTCHRWWATASNHANETGQPWPAMAPKRFAKRSWPPRGAYTSTSVPRSRGTRTLRCRSSHPRRQQAQGIWPAATRCCHATIGHTCPPTCLRRVRRAGTRPRSRHRMVDGDAAAAVRYRRRHARSRQGPQAHRHLVACSVAVRGRGPGRRPIDAGAALAKGQSRSRITQVQSPVACGVGTSHASAAGYAPSGRH